MDKQYLFCICNKYPNFWSLDLKNNTLQVKQNELDLESMEGWQDLDPIPAVTLVQVTTEKVLALGECETRSQQPSTSNSQVKIFVE